MTKISDFTQSEIWTIESTLKERWGKNNEVELQFADTEIRLHLGDKETTECPAVIWQHEGCNYIIFKSGIQSYRCQFFYKGYQQYGTGIHEYDDIGDCIISLLQVQSDQNRNNNIEIENDDGSLPRGTEIKK